MKNVTEKDLIIQAIQFTTGDEVVAMKPLDFDMENYLYRKIQSDESLSDNRWYSISIARIERVLAENKLAFIREEYNHAS